MPFLNLIRPNNRKNTTLNNILQNEGIVQMLKSSSEIRWSWIYSIKYKYMIFSFFCYVHSLFSLMLNDAQIDWYVSDIMFIRKWIFKWTSLLLLLYTITFSQTQNLIPILCITIVSYFPEELRNNIWNVLIFINVQGGIYYTKILYYFANLFNEK